MKQKHFIDIAHINHGTEFSEANTGGFQKGDIVQISEKIDGANTCMRYDVETNTLVAFSRNHKLTPINTLHGFYNYTQSLNANEYKRHKDWYVFGEWLIPHSIPYRQECYQQWYVYDIYDSLTLQWLSQTEVKRFCEEHNLNYINVFYEGEFINWEHCEQFCGKSAYTENGVGGEGYVIKNQTNLNGQIIRQPFVLKRVTELLSEIKRSNHIKKIQNPQEVEARKQSQEIVETIITEQRITKELFKMMDENILPTMNTPEDMKTVAQNLPKRIYEDCLKEQPEYVEAAGEYFGKFCQGYVMRLAKQIIFNKEIDRYDRYTRGIH